MRINNITSDHAVGRMRGRNLGGRAAPGAVSVTDGITDVPGVAEFVFPAGVVSELADGVAQIGVGAMLQSVTNDSGTDLTAGDVVVIDTSGDIITTTTAQDTRPVGIVMAPIADGDDGPIAFSGYVPLVNVTASVTAGRFLETSTVAGQAKESTLRRMGSFGLILTGGTAPTALLWNPPDISAGLAGGEFVKTYDGGEERINTVSASGATETLDLADGNVHDVTLTANCTFTLTGATNGLACTMTVILRQDGTGSRTATWPGSVTWLAGAAPALQTAAAAKDVAVLWSLDGGTTWGGTLVGSGLLTVKDDGVALATAAQSLDFVGAGVTASGTGAAKTITIPDNTVNGVTVSGTPSTGQVLTATGSATADWEAPANGGAHAHVASETHLSNGSTTTWTLDQTFEPGSVIAWNTTTLARLTVTEAAPDQATVSAAGTTGDSIVFDYAATVV